ncbi:MAG: DUF1987 domain-containing protein [Flavobacteriales bacterium]|nr:DUF1987 domain-containing protein [Flavobacteriales bacterium]
MATKRLHIDRTESSPEIDMDLEHGMIEFTGRSLPANGELFYGRVYRWLEEYLKQPRAETVVNMKMDYLDTSSSKHFFNIFDKLNAVCERGQKVHVNWHYETGDEEMAEAGKDFQSFFTLDFDFVEVEELF